MWPQARFVLPIMRILGKSVPVYSNTISKYAQHYRHASSVIACAVRNRVLSRVMFVRSIKCERSFPFVLSTGRKICPPISRALFDVYTSNFFYVRTSVFMDGSMLLLYRVLFARLACRAAGNRRAAPLCSRAPANTRRPSFATGVAARSFSKKCPHKVYI